MSIILGQQDLVADAGRIALMSEYGEQDAVHPAHILESNY